MADLGDFTPAVAEDQRIAGEPDTFTFYGERFALADVLPGMPLLDFAQAARSGTDSSTMEGLAAMHDLIRGCLADAPVLGDEDEHGSRPILAHDWNRFRVLCTDKRVDNDTLMGLCTQLMGAATGRPTSQPSGSPEGQSTDTATSKSGHLALASPAQPSFDERMRARGMEPVEEIARDLATAGP